MQEFNTQPGLDQGIDDFSQAVIPHVVNPLLPLEVGGIRTFGLGLVGFLGEEIGIIYNDPLFRVGAEDAHERVIFDDVEESAWLEKTGDHLSSSL